MMKLWNIFSCVLCLLCLSVYVIVHFGVANTMNNLIHDRNSSSVLNQELHETISRDSTRGNDVSFLEKKIHSVKQPDTSHPNNKSNSTINHTRFLLSIQKQGHGGANSQIHAFIKTIIMALVSNRTLVMTPFFLHGGHVRGYTLAHMRAFNETFDVKYLEELLPLATVKEFKKQCNTSDITVVAWDSIGYTETRKDTFGTYVGIDLPPYEDIMTVVHANITQLEELVEHPQCLALYNPSHSQLEINNENEIISTIKTYLKRSTLVTEATDHLLTNFCDGKPYLALHWRNRSAEGCFFGKAGDCAYILSELSKVVGNVTHAVAEVMKKQKLSCLYVACPEWSLAIIDHLSEVIPRKKIFTLRELPVNDHNKGLLNDYYFTSLIEQEICYRSTIFLSAGNSNWSKFVTMERDVELRTTYGIHELPGIPDRKHAVHALL